MIIFKSSFPITLSGWTLRGLTTLVELPGAGLGGLIVIILVEGGACVLRARIWVVGGNRPVYIDPLKGGEGY